MYKPTLTLLGLALAGSLTARGQYDGNHALSFIGTDQYVAEPELALSHRSFTIEAWVRRDSSNRWVLFRSQGVGVNTNGLHVGFRANNRFTLGFFGDDLIYTTPVLDGDWHHWAVTFEATTRARRNHLDGDLVASDTPAVAYQGSGPLRLASTPFVSGSFFRGALDELRIWTIARSLEDIQDARNRTLSGTEEGLAIYYRLDAMAGSTITNWLRPPAPRGMEK